MKKGFTLIELLTVIVILGVIAAITVPVITDLIQNSRVDSCEETVRTIENAAKRWHTANPTNGEGASVSIETLQTEGYLSSKDDIVNPITNESMKDVLVTISYDEGNNQYSYTLPEDTCLVE